MRALYRAEDEGNADIATLQAELEELRSSTQGSRVRLFFLEGERTADGRIIDPNATNFNRPPPLPIRIQTRQSEAGGHAGAEICGVIETLARDGQVIIAEGRLDLNSAAGQEAERLLRERIMQTWSPDFGDATIDIEEQFEDDDGTIPQEPLAHFVQATFLGATLVAMPALASAMVELLTENGTVLVEAPVRQPTPTEPVAEPEPAPKEREESVAEISACAGPAAPPTSFFSDPKLPAPQRFITITPEGRVYGHVACWGECHIGYGDVCVEPPRGNSYSYFHIGQVKTAEGTLVSTGPISLKGGHATRSLSAQEAQAHYDDTDRAIADVVLGEDDHGIYFTGALRSTVSEDQLRTFRASGVSGDWRRIENSLELIGICSVNTPGFPKVRLTASANGDVEILALVAAGGPPVGLDSPCECEDCSEESDDSSAILAELNRISSLLRASGLEDQAFENLAKDL